MESRMGAVVDVKRRRLQRMRDGAERGMMEE